MTNQRELRQVSNVIKKKRYFGEEKELIASYLQIGKNGISPRADQRSLIRVITPISAIFFANILVNKEMYFFFVKLLISLVLV